MEDKWVYALGGFAIGAFLVYFIQKAPAAAVRRMAATGQVGVPWKDYIPNSFMFGPTPPQYGYAREVETTPAQGTYA